MQPLDHPLGHTLLRSIIPMPDLPSGNSETDTPSHIFKPAASECLIQPRQSSSINTCPAIHPTYPFGDHLFSMFYSSQNSPSSHHVRCLWFHPPESWNHEPGFFQAMNQHTILHSSHNQLVQQFWPTSAMTPVSERGQSSWFYSDPTPSVQWATCNLEHLQYCEYQKFLQHCGNNDGWNRHRNHPCTLPTRKKKGWKVDDEHMWRTDMQTNTPRSSIAVRTNGES